MESEPNQDYTPIAVARQGVRWILDKVLVRPPKVMCDPCAGGGVFGRVFAEESPETIRWGVDINDGAWKQHYNWTEVGPIQTVGARLKQPDQFACDVIQTNPDFGIVYECLPLWLELAPVVVLYCKDDLGQRSTTRGMFGNLPYPAIFARIPGAVFHRLDAMGRPKSDSRSYGWWVFEAAPGYLKPLEEQERWETLNLPLLPGADRKITWGETPEALADDGFDSEETPCQHGDDGW